MASIVDIQVSKWKPVVMLTEGGAPSGKPFGSAGAELRLEAPRWYNRRTPEKERARRLEGAGR